MGETKSNDWTDETTYAGLNLLAWPLLVLMNGWVFQALLLWFLPALAVHFWQAVGICFGARWMCRTTIEWPNTPLFKITAQQHFQRTMAYAVSCLMIWGTGWFVHLLMVAG